LHVRIFVYPILFNSIFPILIPFPLKYRNKNGREVFPPVSVYFHPLIIAKKKGTKKENSQFLSTHWGPGVVFLIGLPQPTSGLPNESSSMDDDGSSVCGPRAVTVEATLTQG
jgi:hypothetical protein